MASAEDYMSFTDIEHVRNKPGMYIGSISTVKECRWVIKHGENGADECTQEEIESNPGLEQCILELMTNAADHVQRCKTEKLDPVTKIKIDITDDSISIYNNGQGIPTGIHPVTKIHVPEMIFGNMRTSSNYDDTKKRIVGGTNGIGSKAANIFSTKFIIELQTGSEKYYQEFLNGLKNKTKPKITKATTKSDYVKITYYPDFAAFGMKNFKSNDILKLIEKRAYDLSAATGKETSITYNDVKIPIKDFNDYMTLFIGDSPKVTYKSDRWEVGFALCPYDTATQISFVNAICTDDGGTHVKHILDPVLTKITDDLQKKAKGFTIKKQYIKDNIIVFIKCLIENPSFASQLKRELTTKTSDFGSKCLIPEQIIKKIANLGITDNVLEIAKAKELKNAMKKIDGTKNTSLIKIAKLSDANWAGKAKAMECTLILTEGDSVLSDTPLTLRNSSGQIIIKNIEDLTSDFTLINGKEYGKTEYEIWTERGWTNIKHVMRHKTSKKIYRILTHTGCVDVTEDHSLINKESKEITPGACNISDELLHSFPLFKENKIEIPNNYENLEVRELWKIASDLKIRYYQSIKKTELINIIRKYKDSEIHEFINCKVGNYDINSEEAYVLGLFFADGNCGLYGEKNRSTWGISNTNLLFLEKSLKILNDIYGDTFSIYTMKTVPSSLTINCKNLKQQYKLYLNGGIKTKYITEKYRNLLYYKKWKYIHPMILNSSRNIREKFLEGYYDGDGQHDLKSRMKMDIYGKITAQCIYTLCNSLGYQTSINHNYKKPNIYTIGISKGTFQKNPDIIKKIIELPCEERYVYDLETENHHFQAGIGRLIVHNSAAGLSHHGISSAGGRDKWGIFPLRGKFLNIRKATAEQLIENEEIKAVNSILGLKDGLKDIKKLRYGRVLLFSDQDTDGHHIKGLLINYFTFYWPEIVEQGLLEFMITPIIKVFKGNKLLKQFYNLNDHEKWIKTEKPTGIREKYYKGLATSTETEAKDYFTNLTSNKKKYNYKSKDHEELLIRTFDNKFSDERKKWITNYLKNPEEVDYTKKEMSIDYFIDRELVQFSVADNVRSIPSIIDGFKPSQRKVLFACLKRNLFMKNDGSGEVKVSDLSGYIAEHSAYHHGDASLHGTIINMAQDFVGSNNINLLLPIGNYGTRIMGGKDSGSPRYIFTCLRNEVKILFNEYDNKILNYIIDEGKSIEPDFYVPIVPMILVNGASGVGTGWSTDIPSFNLDTIIENIRILLDDEDAPLKDMIPYYKSFKGQVIKVAENSWKSIGVAKYSGSHTVDISELPVGMWKEDFEEFLNKLLEADMIKGFKVTDNDPTKNANDVCYRVELYSKVDDLIKFFKLSKNIKGGSNMVAFDEKGTISKYESVEDILWTFYKYRLSFYKKRQDYISSILGEEIKKVSEKLRFIQYVVSDKIIINKQKKADIISQLTENNFENHTNLLNIPAYSFTFEEIEKLEKSLDDLNDELKTLMSKTPKDLWKIDLDILQKSQKNIQTV